MISLEQIRQLQDKVNKAVELMGNLQAEKDLLEEENTLLHGKISSYETRIAELESLIAAFKNEQSEIEEGIISALKHLDTLEEAVEGLRPETAATEAAEAGTVEYREPVAPPPAMEEATASAAMDEATEEPAPEGQSWEEPQAGANLAPEAEPEPEPAEESGEPSGQLDIF